MNTTTPPRDGQRWDGTNFGAAMVSTGDSFDGRPRIIPRPSKETVR